MANKKMLVDAKIPTLHDSKLLNAMSVLNCDKVAFVPIVVKPHTKLNRCHTNVELYVSMYGGEKITGYYVAVSENENKWVAIKHSIWNNDGLVDITPINDQRTHNVFVWGSTKLYTEVYSDNNQVIVNNKILFEDFTKDNNVNFSSL